MKYLEDFSNPQKSWEVERVEWRKVKLKEIILKTEKINPENKDPDEIFLYLDISNIDNKKFRVNGWKKLKWKDAPSRARKLIKVGDIVFATTRPYLKNIAIVPLDLDGQICSTGFCVLRPNPEFTTSEWIFYNIIRDKFVSHISSKMRGTSYPAVLDSDIYFSKIPLPFCYGKPDLETQKKIVEYIEASFARIDKILEKKKKELGRLDELWESVLEQAFKPKEEEEWREVNFLDKITLVKGTKPKKTVKEEKERTLPYLTTEYFRERIIKEYVSIEEKKITIVNEGDLVIIADGSRSGELFFCDIKGVLVSTLAKFEFNESKINKKYLFWFLTTHFEHLNKSKYTATPHVNKNHLKNLKIPLPFRNNRPDLEKQKEIANYLDGVYEKIKTLKEKIQNQIKHLEEMKESILEEVFNHEEIQ